jgi:hypothetical protein
VLSKTRVLVEAEMIAKGEEQIELNAVKEAVKDFRAILEEGDLQSEKHFYGLSLKKKGKHWKRSKGNSQAATA